jgi:asparagine synthase (glutamine-hydrolysing)
MCGLTGFVSKNGISGTCLLSMNNSIRHRGPDDEGYVLFDIKNPLSSFEFIGHDSPVELNYINNIEYANIASNNFNIGFAHRRLSILDLSVGGHQPMKDSSGVFWIVFNGEIYNYKEL